MRDQRIPAPAAGDPSSLEQALLGLLLHDHPGLWSLTELTRSLTPSSAPDPIAVEDAAETLYAAGLLHRLGDLVCATRSAHVGQRLAE